MSEPEPNTADFAGIAGAAVVTGGSGGIGSAICHLLVERGSRVLFTYHSRSDRAEEIARAAPNSMCAIRADLTERDAGSALVTAAHERFGGVHTFVHAAGPIVPQVYASNIHAAQFERHLLAEAAGFFNVAHALLPSLRQAAGSIVAVTTVAGRRFPPRDVLSSGPKAAVEAVIRALAAEEGRYGVRANCVGPGILDEGMTERLAADGDMSDAAFASALERIPLKRFGKATDVAEAVCFLASPRAAYITGQYLDIDGGYAL